MTLKIFNRRARAIERANRYAGAIVNGSAKPGRRAEIIGIDGAGDLISNVSRPVYSFERPRFERIA